jgi:hypothetical protein
VLVRTGSWVVSCVVACRVFIPFLDDEDILVGISCGSRTKPLEGGVVEEGIFDVANYEQREHAM